LHRRGTLTRRYAPAVDRARYRRGGRLARLQRRNAGSQAIAGRRACQSASGKNGWSARFVHFPSYPWPCAAAGARPVVHDFLWDLIIGPLSPIVIFAKGERRIGGNTPKFGVSKHPTAVARSAETTARLSDRRLDGQVFTRVPSAATNHAAQKAI